MRTNKRAAAFIIKDKKILLFHRIKDGREYFVFPGGGVEEGETTEEALIRELKEELCIDAKIDQFLFEIFVPKNAHDDGRTSYFYLVTSFSGTPELGGPEKEKMNINNQYYPYWTEIENIENMDNLYQEEAKEKLIEYLKISKD